MKKNRAQLLKEAKVRKGRELMKAQVSDWPPQDFRTPRQRYRVLCG